MSTFNRVCPHCGHAGTVTPERMSTDIHFFDKGNRLGALGLASVVLVCPNPECLEFTLSASLRSAAFEGPRGWRVQGEPLRKWQLIPDAEMVVIPDYVPEAIRADYREACLIRDLSPKASATLARRCLQGMIRDFWDVKPGRLVDEIQAIEDRIDSVTWDAIEAVRKIGNIGAHMESDINVIVDVDPGEASLLIQLVETLVQEWYVARHERAQRMNRLIAVSAEKAELRKLPAASPRALPAGTGPSGSEDGAG